MLNLLTSPTPSFLVAKVHPAPQSVYEVKVTVLLYVVQTKSNEGCLSIVRVHVGAGAGAGAGVTLLACP